MKKRKKSWKKLYKGIEKSIQHKKKKVKKLKKTIIERKLRARLKELEGMAKERERVNILAKRRGFFK